MGKFYISAAILFLGGLALFHFGNKSPRETNPTATFAGSCLMLIGAATFTLAFGYHVRAVSESLPR